MLATSRSCRGNICYFGNPENSSENVDSNLKNKQDLNPLSIVKILRLKNVNKALTEQININPTSSKFNQLK